MGFGIACGQDAIIGVGNMGTTVQTYPSYLALYETGELRRRAHAALELLRGHSHVRKGYFLLVEPLIHLP